MFSVERQGGLWEITTKIKEITIKTGKKEMLS
jgi:hypothetical protein